MGFLLSLIIRNILIHTLGIHIDQVVDTTALQEATKDPLQQVTFHFVGIHSAGTHSTIGAIVAITVAAFILFQLFARRGRWWWLFRRRGSGSI